MVHSLAKYAYSRKWYDRVLSLQKAQVFATKGILRELSFYT